MRGLARPRAAGQGLAHAIEEHPLAAGAASFCAGVLIGLALPLMRHEDALMGNSADGLTDPAKPAAAQALERGRELAEQTASAALTTVERRGLTPDRLGETGR